MLAPTQNHKTGVSVLVELGPHTALQGPLKQIFKAMGGDAEKTPYVSVLSRKREAIDSYVTMALKATKQRAEIADAMFSKYELRDITVLSPLVIPDEDVEMTTTLRLYREGTDSNGVDDVRCNGTSRALLQPTIASISEAARSPVLVDKLYADLSDFGVVYDPTFQDIDECRACNTCAYARLVVRDVTKEMPCHRTEADRYRQLCYRLDWEPILSPINKELDTATYGSSGDEAALSNSEIEIVHGGGALQTQPALNLVELLEHSTGKRRNTSTLIKFRDVGANHRDVIIAHGKLSNADFRIEASGIIIDMGSNISNLKPTLPLAYSAAYYSLVELGRLQEEESALFHAGAGAVGQAAISLAQMIGAELYVTVGSSEKKRLLVTEYGLREDHIFYSRDTAFGDAVRQPTKDRGVDVVVNCLASEGLRDSWHCLSTFGRLIDIRTHDTTASTRLETAQVDHNASFISLNMMALAAQRPRLMHSLLWSVSKAHQIWQGWSISPTTIFNISEVESALNSEDTAGCKDAEETDRGTPHANDIAKATPPKKPRQLLKENATYIHVGDSGGLGRSMSRWTVKRGVWQLVLVSKSASTIGKVKELIDEAAGAGATTVVRRCNVADPADVKQLITHGLEGILPREGCDSWRNGASDLTAISETGYLMEDLDKAAEVAKSLGGDAICEAEVLALVGTAISGDLTTTCNNHIITGMRISLTLSQFWAQDAKSKYLREDAEALAAVEASAGVVKTISYNAALKSAGTLHEVEDIVCKGLMHKLAAVMIMELEDLGATTPVQLPPGCD
ncbi:hypothetical protein DL764_009408 [Monosporascus ibericus]|uniref:Enoyl reductase (ER) domain-containing protein n=1 Tax=Monosporascus ibericus TaxID=155417 RepID=A0A4Q4SV05_9PEZI|nr:hypothetical protein DL764_009408 [Monosporascus ibericus]